MADNALIPDDPNYPQFSPNSLGGGLPFAFAPESVPSAHWWERPIVPAIPSAVKAAINMGYNALVGPGEIATGKSPIGAPAHPDPQEVAQDITGSLLGAGGLVSAPENAMLSFGGKLAATSNWNARALALQMERAGASREEILDETRGRYGQAWSRDVDGNLKFEISNEGAELAPKLRGINDPVNYISRQQDRGVSHTLKDVYDDPALYAAYPDLKNIKIQTMKDGSAFYNHGANTIGIGPGAATNRLEFLTTIMHEAQHAIQHREGFATGANYREFETTPEALQWTAEKNALTKVSREVADKAYDAARAAGYDPMDAFNGLKAHNEQALTSSFRSPQYLTEQKAGWDADLAHPVMQLPEVQNAVGAIDATIQHKLRPENPFMRYLQSAGEVEARNVEERYIQGLAGTGDPWQTEGYWKAMQNVRFQSGRSEQDESFRGFHGTPHEFQPTEENPFGEFSDAAIGSGEGAQVYGHGHYVAGARATAEDYQKNLANPQTLLNGEPVSTDLLLKNPHINRAVNTLEHYDGDIDGAIKGLRVHSQKYEGYYGEDAEGNKAANWLEENKNNIEHKSGGNLHLEIKPDEEELLDWDKPLAQQSPSVLKALEAVHPRAKDIIDNEKIFSRQYGPGYDDRAWKGEDIYKMLSNELPSEQAASSALKAAGIPGIKYLDQFSRSRNPDKGDAYFDGKPIYTADKGFTAHASPQGSDDLMSGAMSTVAGFGGVDGALKWLKTPSMFDDDTGATKWKPQYIDFIEKNRDRIKYEKPKLTSNYVIFDPKNIRIVGKNNQILGMEETEGNPFK